MLTLIWLDVTTGQNKALNQNSIILKWTERMTKILLLLGPLPNMLSEKSVSTYNPGLRFG